MKPNNLNNIQVLEELKKRIQDSQKTFEGIVKTTKEKYGFLVVENHQDVFIPPVEMDKVFSGDRVSLLVKNFDSPRSDQKFSIEKIIESKVKTVIGKLKEEENGIYVYSEYPIKNKKIRVPKTYSKKANNNDYVVLEILEHPFINKKPKGKVIEIIGREENPGFEFDYSIYKYSLPNVFSPEIKKEVKMFDENYILNAGKDYKDFTDINFISIDGENTNDIDDLLYAEKSINGWKLLVAISDVSAFIKENDIFDIEAYNRTSSVYFLGKNISMIPPELSSDLCSLKENVNRLAIVVELYISHNGEVISYNFNEAIVKSKAKMNYNEIELYLSGEEKALKEKYPTAIINNIDTLYLLHKALKDNRNSNATLQVVRDDYKITLDQNKKIKEIVPFEYKTSNRIVEECMLIANITASKFVKNNYKQALYRSTTEIDNSRFTLLKEFLNEYQIQINKEQLENVEKLKSVFEKIDKNSDSEYIKKIVSMYLMKSEYTEKSKPHLAIGTNEYLFFTSPIRRYADLLIHRMIKAVLHKEKYNVTKEALTENLNAKYRNITNATRESENWLKCYYAETLKEKEFLAIIIGTTMNSINAKIISNGINGFITFKNTENVQLVNKEMKLVTLKKEYKIGDALNIGIKKINYENRSIEFEEIEKAQ